MKKALIVTSTAGFAKSFLFHDMQLLQSMGYEVHCAANKIGTMTFNVDEFFPNNNVTFHHVDFSTSSPLGKQTRDSYKQIKALLKEQNFDVIHCHTPIVGAVVRLAARRYRKKGCRVLYTTHGLAFPKGADFKSKLIYGTTEKVCARWSDAIITINRADCEMMQKTACKNVFRINGVGVDTKRYHEVELDRDAYRAELGVSPEDTMVLSVGELSPRKNHRVIIRALAELNDPKYVFVICGKVMVGCGTHKMLQELAAELGVRVIFLGFRSDIPQVTHCADIAVLPSIREGLGLAGIEALACGVPVIGTAVQGIMDYVVDGETGFLCRDPHSAVEFADRIKELSDPALRARMRAACVEKAEEFSTEVSWQQMEDIYRKILS